MIWFILVFLIALRRWCKDTMGFTQEEFDYLTMDEKDDYF